MLLFLFLQLSFYAFFTPGAFRCSKVCTGSVLGVNRLLQIKVSLRLLLVNGEGACFVGVGWLRVQKYSYKNKHKPKSADTCSDKFFIAGDVSKHQFKNAASQVRLNEHCALLKTAIWLQKKMYHNLPLCISLHLQEYHIMKCWPCHVSAD